CTCPAICGDGFVGPGEVCDPGGPGGNPPPSDAACPGQCLQGTCTCPPAICGNGTIEPGEVCELPQVNCGPLQICVGCTQCAPCRCVGAERLRETRATVREGAGRRAPSAAAAGRRVQPLVDVGGRVILDVVDLAIEHLRRRRDERAVERRRD